MANNANIQDMPPALPLELRIIILDYVLEDFRLWVVTYGLDGLAPGVIQQFISIEESEGNHPPHPLCYVNHSIAEQIRQHWERHFDGRLQVNTYLTSFPAQIFNGIINLSLTMPQAARSLQVTVPHLPRNYGYMVTPSTQLVLAHGPPVRNLEIN